MTHGNRTNEQGQGKGRPRCFDRDQALHRALELFWQRGYEPASVAELCKVMEIRPPSLYAAFGNKASLFLEALDYYEHTYWDEPAKRFCAEPDVYRAVENYFREAARILLSPETPCGCMVVLAAVNISQDDHRQGAGVQAGNAADVCRSFPQGHCRWPDSGRHGCPCPGKSAQYHARRPVPAGQGWPFSLRACEHGYPGSAPLAPKNHAVLTGKVWTVLLSQIF